MNDDYKSTAPIAQLGGAKRKNGHKANCCCHICDNIKNKIKRGGYEEDAEKQKMKLMGGSKKKNGHKMECSCPICKNMKNAKKGGYSEEKTEGEYNEMDKNDSNITGGKKSKGNGTRKSNGHKPNCGGPICKNMRKKTRKGGNEEPDIENQLGDIEEGNVKGITSNDSNEILAKDNEYEHVDFILDAAEKGDAGSGIKVGGTRRRHKLRKGNKKTRHHRKRSHKRK